MGVGVSSSPSAVMTSHGRVSPANEHKLLQSKERLGAGVLNTQSCPVILAYKLPDVLGTHVSDEHSSHIQRIDRVCPES